MRLQLLQLRWSTRWSSPTQVKSQNSIKWTMFMEKTWPSREEPQPRSRHRRLRSNQGRQHSRALKKSLTWWVQRPPYLTPGTRSTLGFMIYNPVGTWGSLVTCEGMPVHSVGFSNILLLHSVGDNNIPPTVTTINVSRKVNKMSLSRSNGSNLQRILVSQRLIPISIS